MELASYLAENGAWARGQESGLSSEGHCVCGVEAAGRQGRQGRQRRVPGKGRRVTQRPAARSLLPAHSRSVHTRVSS